MIFSKKSFSVQNKLLFLLASGGGTLVEHSPRYSKVMGSSPAPAGTGREEIAKMTNNGHRQQISYWGSHYSYWESHCSLVEKQENINENINDPGFISQPGETLKKTKN